VFDNVAISTISVFIKFCDFKRLCFHDFTSFLIASTVETGQSQKKAIGRKTTPKRERSEWSGQRD